jgi:hypothetical protein
MDNHRRATAARQLIYPGFLDALEQLRGTYEPLVLRPRRGSKMTMSDYFYVQVTLVIKEYRLELGDRL